MFQKFCRYILKVRKEVFTEPKAKAEVLNSQFSIFLNNEETENIPDPGKNPIPTIGIGPPPPPQKKKNLVCKGECPGNIKGS